MKIPYPEGLLKKKKKHDALVLKRLDLPGKTELRNNLYLNIFTAFSINSKKPKCPLYLERNPLYDLLIEKSPREIPMRKEDVLTLLISNNRIKYNFSFHPYDVFVTDFMTLKFKDLWKVSDRQDFVLAAFTWRTSSRDCPLPNKLWQSRNQLLQLQVQIEQPVTVALMALARECQRKLTKLTCNKAYVLVPRSRWTCMLSGPSILYIFCIFKR